ncbi:MAG TPA: HEAT repeat domain-containing protein [Pseudomonadales bacterium]
MNPWIDIVDSLQAPSERMNALRLIEDGRVGARANRGRPLPPDRVDALIWGLSHASPVVRRCCLELLDQHPDDRARPHIVRCLSDPVPRVRWHAVHALICDACKAGTSYLAADVVSRLRELAQSDPSRKVRAQAQWGLQQANICT